MYYTVHLTQSCAGDSKSFNISKISPENKFLVHLTFDQFDFLIFFLYYDYKKYNSMPRRSLLLCGSSSSRRRMRISGSSSICTISFPAYTCLLCIVRLVPARQSLGVRVQAVIHQQLLPITDITCTEESHRRYKCEWSQCEPG